MIITTKQARARLARFLPVYAQWQAQGERGPVLTRQRVYRINAERGTEQLKIKALSSGKVHLVSVTADLFDDGARPATAEVQA